MKTDLIKHFEKSHDVSELIADHIKNRAEKGGEEIVKKNKAIMFPSQLEAVQKIMRMHDASKILMHGFQKFRAENGEGVMVLFMPEDMHIGIHREHGVKNIDEILSGKMKNVMNIIPKLSFFDVERRALMNCVDEVNWEDAVIKKTCNTKVKVKFEGQHPVPFYHKGRW